MQRAGCVKHFRLSIPSMEEFKKQNEETTLYLRRMDLSKRIRMVLVFEVGYITA